MNLRTAAIAAIALSALLACSNVSAATDKAGIKPPVAEINALYWQGHEALGSGDWSLSLRRFADLERRLRQREPSVADAAIYWQAYALMRAGRNDEAAATVSRLRGEFPRSRWNDDATRLLRRDGASAGNVADGDAQAEASLESLLSRPPGQAIPRLVTLLQGQHPPQHKKRALFVLSQIDDPGAVAQLVAVARGRDPALRAEAVRLLGIIGAKDEFREVYAAALGTARKRQVLNAMGVAGADGALAEVARTDPDAGLRRSALQALGVAGNVDVLAEVAGGNADLQTRREAIKALGVAGGLNRLRALYPKVLGIPELRDEVLRSLLVAKDERVVLEIYRQAKTPEEKQAVLRILREAGHNLRAGR